jgi:hypothetical protein
VRTLDNPNQTTRTLRRLSLLTADLIQHYHVEQASVEPPPVEVVVRQPTTGDLGRSLSGEALDALSTIHVSAEYAVVLLPQPGSVMTASCRHAAQRTQYGSHLWLGVLWSELLPFKGSKESKNLCCCVGCVRC